jgi:outer membrane protein assembly factor BamA
MIKKMIVLLLVILVLGFHTYASVDTGKEAEEQTEIEALTRKCKKRIIAAPILFYTPETRLAYGAAGSYIFRMAGCKKDSRPSSISPIVIYTQEKQFKAQLNTDLFFKDNKYRLKTEIKLEKYPNKFYGVGNDTLEENEELYTSRSTGFLVSFLKKIGKGFNLGLQYHFTDWEIVETEEQGQLVTGLLPGSSEGTLSGVGLLANRDTRDNIFYPMKGDFFELDARLYRKFLGSKFNFTSLTLNLRKYVTLFSSHVFAVQSLVKIQTGTVPFLHLAQMGGQYNMRGYFEGRFRDKNMMVFQAEYRMPLFWRFGLVGFAGLGNVAEKFSQLDLGSLKSSYGFGLRFLFDKKEKIQVRLDIGFGKDSSGFYFSVFEAF